MKTVAGKWKWALALAGFWALARLGCFLFRETLIVRAGILAANLMETAATAMAALFALLAAALFASGALAKRKGEEKMARESFVEGMMEEAGPKSESESIIKRLSAEAEKNPSLNDLFRQGIEQIRFIEGMMDEFRRIFSGVKNAGGVQDTILEELEKDRLAVLEGLRDVLRWTPSPSVRRHYDDYVRNMKANLAENDTSIAKYEDLKFATLEYLENKGARPDRDIGIDSLYEAIKTLTEREKGQTFPRDGIGGNI
jgi:hypothetical protein